MYIAKVPNRNSPPAYLLRESYREHGKVKNRTLANLSRLPIEQIKAMRRVLRGETLVPAAEALQIQRSTPHGHAAAFLGTARKLGLDQMLDRRPSRQRDLVMAMIAARVLHPGSKLATARRLSKQTRSSALGEMLGLDRVDEDDLYDAMDWLIERQARIEKKLAQKHLRDGSLVLYDLSSSYYTGHCCSLAQLGHKRDGKRGVPQINYGLLCDRDGCPIATEVFDGNTGDPATVATQIAAEAKRRSVVAPARRSDSALQKDRSKRTADGLPVHSFRTLLDDLATLTKNRVRSGEATFDLLATPTALQSETFRLLQITV